MHDGRPAGSAAAESELAVGENRREGIGAYDRRCGAAIGFQLKAVAGTGDLRLRLEAGAGQLQLQRG
jgi:hypothetical protein